MNSGASGRKRGTEKSCGLDGDKHLADQAKKPDATVNRI
jgi:hypothetical protein